MDLLYGEAFHRGYISQENACAYVYMHHTTHTPAGIAEHGLAAQCGRNKKNQEVEYITNIV